MSRGRPLLDSLDAWDAATQDQRRQVIHQLREFLSDRYDHLETRPYQCGDQEHEIAAFVHQATGIIFQLIPGGVRHVYEGFVATEEAQRQVSAFLLARTPINQETWDRWAGSLADERAWQGQDLPMEGIGQESIHAWLKALPGSFRLPFELEWEHAAWAGTSLRFPWGSAPNDDYYWYDKNSQGRTHSLQLHAHKTNAFGLVDMIGHVWELCHEGHGNGGCHSSHGYSFDLQLDGPVKARNNVGFRLADSID